MRANRDAVSFAVNGTSLNFSIHVDGIALGPYYNPKTGNELINILINEYLKLIY